MDPPRAWAYVDAHARIRSRSLQRLCDLLFRRRVAAELHHVDRLPISADLRERRLRQLFLRRRGAHLLDRFGLRDAPTLRLGMLRRGRSGDLPDQLRLLDRGAHARLQSAHWSLRRLRGEPRLRGRVCVHGKHLHRDRRLLDRRRLQVERGRSDLQYEHKDLRAVPPRQRLPVGRSDLRRKPPLHRQRHLQLEPRLPKPDAGLLDGRDVRRVQRQHRLRERARLQRLAHLRAAERDDVRSAQRRRHRHRLRLEPEHAALPARFGRREHRLLRRLRQRCGVPARRCLLDRKCLHAAALLGQHGLQKSGGAGLQHEREPPWLRRLSPEPRLPEQRHLPGRSHLPGASHQRLHQ